MNKIRNYFLASEGEKEASGLFSLPHFILLFLTACTIDGFLRMTLALPHEKLRKIIGCISIQLWVLELLKITFKLTRERSKSRYDSWVPLYYCSLALYASALSGFSEGILQHMGDIFLAVGVLIGGICFLLYPSSSIMIYPWYHFLTIHSFFYHGCMIYLGILVNRSGMIDLNWDDLPYYVLFFSFFCLIAYLINRKRGTNLMFISQSFKGTILEPVQKLMKRAYTPLVIAVHEIIPFAVIMFFKLETSLLNRPMWYPTVY